VPGVQDIESSEGRSKLPGGFPVVLLHDLVDSAQVGDVIEVTGVIRQKSLGQTPNGVQCTWCMTM
jgi:DNA replicative helicase MCM subunit Mcm2 (Cdc46/Mcm family)